MNECRCVRTCTTDYTMERGRWPSARPSLHRHTGGTARFIQSTYIRECGMPAEPPRSGNRLTRYGVGMYVCTVPTEHGVVPYFNYSVLSGLLSPFTYAGLPSTVFRAVARRMSNQPRIDLQRAGFLMVGLAGADGGPEPRSSRLNAVTAATDMPKSRYNTGNESFRRAAMM
ncbi:hypothetical protein L209DRAFT_546701 [Thermothelomyces heterothallicus CBS 203.75]